MLTSKTLIERLNHYEQENKELTERIEFYQRKTQRLEKRNKEIYEGFITTTQELCDTTKKYEDYKARCEEVIEYLQEEGVCIMNKGKQENERLVWDWQNYYELLNILNGGDE